MNNEPDNDRLLNDVLGESADAFRAGVLDATLRGVRRRRRVRLAANMVLATVILGLCALWMWRPASLPPNLPIRAAKPSEPSSLVVRSQPLTAAMIVRTSDVGVETVSTTARDLTIVTTPRISVERLDDDGLLRLVANHPAALVRWKDRPAELVFINAEDKAHFLMP